MVSQKKRGQKFSQKFTKFSHAAAKDSATHVQKNLLARLPHARNVRLLILEWSLLLAVLILFAITQAFWYSDASSMQSFTSGGTYTEATTGKIDSLNPLFATTESEEALSRLLFATLTATDYSGHTGVGLSDSITTDETGKIWTLKLRNNLKWSDGQPITNQDVIFTVSLIQNPAVNSIYSANLAKVSVAEQDGVLVFTLPASYANFDSALTIPILPYHILKDVAPAKLLEHDFSNNPVTSAAFSYNATQTINSSTGEKIVYLSANPYYYGGAPLLEGFAIHSYPDTTAVAGAIKSGAVTATASLLPSADIESGSIYKKQTTINSGVFAFINTSSNILNSKTLRRAIQQGIDVQELRSDLTGESALNYPILAGQIDGVTYPELPAYDPTAATETILAAGLDSSVVLEIATISTGYLPALAKDLADQLTTLGFTTNVSVYEPGQEFLYNVVRQRSYDILLYEIDLGTDPDVFAYYHSSQASTTGLNLSNYRNSIVDELILAARSSMDSSVRAAKYSAFLRYWIEDVPAIGIYQTNLAYFYNKNTSNFSSDNHLAIAADRFMDVQFWSVTPTAKKRTP